MMVASLDPVGKTVSLLSVPRDLVDMPLGDGNVFGPKLNSLLAYADATPTSSRRAASRTLEDAIGALLGIPIHYYARIDFVRVHRHGRRRRRRGRHRRQGLRRPGLRRVRVRQARLVDHRRAAPSRRHQRAGLRAVAQGARRERLHAGRPPAADPRRAARRGDQRREPPALAAARSCSTRVGERSDDRRAGRRLPALAAIMDEIGNGTSSRAVIRYPLVHPKITRYGVAGARPSRRSGRSPRTCSRRRARRPIPWPTPEPTKTPKPAQRTPDESRPAGQAPGLARLAPSDRPAATSHRTGPAAPARSGVHRA